VQSVSDGRHFFISCTNFLVLCALLVEALREGQSAALEVAEKVTHSFRHLMYTYSYDNIRSLCLIMDRRMEATIFKTLQHISPSHSEREGKAEQQGYPFKMPSKRNQKATKIAIDNFNNAISRCPV